ncbi:MAG: hypothetical protein IT238_07675 [Bacteroidia bacterium]|nr:hypothetical protein [Bacteroidia bacterium]
MLQRDSFYYIPDLMPWSPTSVERNLPLDSMLEIAKMGQAQIDAQLQAIGKLKAGVHGIDAMLDQDTFYKTQKMEEIAGKSKEFASKNLLDRGVQTDLQNYVESIAYDSNLENIANRTKSIREAYKTYYDLFAKGETSEANIYPMLKSIEEANEKFKATNTFDPSMKVDSRLRPYTDVGKVILEGIDKVDVSSMPFSNGKDFQIVDLGNGYQQIVTLEGKSKEALMKAAQTALGEKGMTQLYLDYQYKNSLSEDGLKDDKGNPISFEKYAGEILLNASEAFQTKVLKRDNPMENLYQRRAFELQKLAKQYEYDRNIAQMRINADLEKEKRDKATKGASSVYSAIPAVPTTTGQMVGDFVRSEKSLVSTKSQLDKFVGGYNLKVETDKLIELKENFDNSNYVIPKGMDEETVNKVYDVFRDQQEGSYFSTLVDNYINAKVKRKDWKDIFEDDGELMEAYEAAEKIAEQNRQNINEPWLNFDIIETPAGKMKDRYLNLGKFGKYFSTVGNPNGTTAEEVLTNAIEKNQGNSWFESLKTKIIAGSEKIKGRVGATTLNYALIPTDSENAAAKATTQLTKGMNISALNIDGFPVSTYKDNNGKEHSITASTKPTNVSFISSGTKPYLQVEVSDGQNTGTLYADVPTSYEESYKEFMLQSISTEANRTKPNGAVLTASVNALNHFDKSFNINLLNAKDYSKMPSERARVIIGDDVSTQNVIPASAGFKVQAGGGKVIKCNIYAVQTAGGSERYFIGYKADQSEGGTDSTVLAFSFEPNYSPAAKGQGNVYFPDMQSAVNAATILKISN